MIESHAAKCALLGTSSSEGWAGKQGIGMANDSSETQFIVASPCMQKVLQLLPRVADSTASVLITGETGTGKELIARAVHSHRTRFRQFKGLN